MTCRMRPYHIIAATDNTISQSKGCLGFWTSLYITLFDSIFITPYEKLE